MDTERSVRLTIPPLILILSLAFGLLTTPHGYEYMLCHAKELQEMGVGAALVVIATSGSLVIAGGFLLSAFSYVTLRVILLASSLIKFKFNRDKTVTELSTWCGDNMSPEDYRFFAKHLHLDSASFNYTNDGFFLLEWLERGSGLLNEDMISWFARRWNGFVIHFHAAYAVVLSYLIGAYFLNGRTFCPDATSTPVSLNTAQNPCWIVVSLLTVLILVSNAYLIRRESTGMWHFLARLPETPSRLGRVIKKPSSSASTE